MANSRPLEDLQDLNSFHLTPRKWIDAAGAIGIRSTAARYGGTFAHRDIAFEFGTWLSPEFPRAA